MDDKHAQLARVETLGLRLGEHVRTAVPSVEVENLPNKPVADEVADFFRRLSLLNDAAAQLN